MNTLIRILMFPFLRRSVESNTLSDFREILNADLASGGFKQMQNLDERILDRLVSEAYRIAAEQEEDHVARYGRMYEAVEYVASQVLLAGRGASDVTPYIRSILVHNDVLKGLDKPKPQPTGPLKEKI